MVFSARNIGTRRALGERANRRASCRTILSSGGAATVHSHMHSVVGKMAQAAAHLLLEAAKRDARWIRSAAVPDLARRRAPPTLRVNARRAYPECARRG